MSWEISFLSLYGDPLALSDNLQHGVNIKDLSRYLGALGLKIDVYSRQEVEGQPDQEEYSRGTRVIRIPIGPSQSIPAKDAIRYLKEISAWIPAYQIKHGLHYQLVHSHHYLSGPVGIHLKNLWGIPLVHTFHSLSAVEEELLGPGNRRLETRYRIEKLICSNADRIIAANDQEKLDLTELYQVDPETISIIPCGVNLDMFQPLPQRESRQEIAFPDDVFLITFVGGLERSKGLDTLLKAMQLIDNPAIQAVIVGGPPSDKPFLSRADLSRTPFKQYIAIVDDYGLERQITFTGGKPQEELAIYYSAGDITVVPSIYEPLGLTAIEAMACGSSVIASRISGLTSIVQENRVGALFKSGSAEQLAEKIKIFYDQPKVNTELRKNTRPYIEENYSWRSVAKAVTSVYQELIG